MANKSDLAFDQDALNRHLAGTEVRPTAAKSGEGGEELFVDLAELL